MSHLLEETKAAENKRGDFYWLSGDSRLMIVAGSDTRSTTLTHVFYDLAKTRRKWPNSAQNSNHW